MFEKILIANRGEIACRIARTCRSLGVRTVAVYSETDKDALHVAQCDEAWPIGQAPAAESYLNAERLIEVARASGAQAIHPGYGFLSENAEFAEACEAAGLVFIGPPAEAIRAMGSKSAAKTIMGEAGVPLVPGYHGEDQSVETLTGAAEEIGYPVLIKASAGGGGKGMRRVDSPQEFAGALAAAQREARAAFGDDRMLIEKFLLEPRHVEVQVFADRHGNAAHLFERDCSVQRRHQKVLEEAPAPGLSEAQRDALGAAALAAARAIDYVGAGTVEFIMDREGAFYFMEMNTRLQVEHPITEQITGQDLVAWQLTVAAGDRLPCTQDELKRRGHAFEARIYAEDPARDFLPATGRIERLRTPPETSHLRIDTGIREGDEVGIHYDPMLAKLIVWDVDRDRALARLREALGEYTIAGLATNVDFLRRLAAHPAFAAGKVDTGFIERYRDVLLEEVAVPDERVLAAAVLHELLMVERHAAAVAATSNDPWSPWHRTDGWQLNGDNFHTLQFRLGEEEYTVTAHYRRDGFLLELPGGSHAAEGSLDETGRLRMRLDGVVFSAQVLAEGEMRAVTVAGVTHRLAVHDPFAAQLDDAADDGALSAPMPGMIRELRVAAGDRVEEGQLLVVLEAMKMEHSILAPASGHVAAVYFSVGDQVAEGAELLAIDAEDNA